MSRAVVKPNSFGHVVYEDGVPSSTILPAGTPNPGRELQSFGVRSVPLGPRMDYRGTPRQLNRIYVRQDQLRARVTTLKALPLRVPTGSPSGSVIRVANKTNQGFRGDMSNLQDWSRTVR